MPLNPFEQLERLVSISEPRQAFEDIVGMLLKECDLVDGRIRVLAETEGSMPIVAALLRANS